MGRAGHGRGIGLALVLALGLALALAGLVVGLGQPGTALAQPTGTTVTCTNDSPADQSSLQSALNAAPTDGTLYTITLSPNCTINLASSLEVGANVNVAIDGNGLVLDGQTKTFPVIAIDDTQSPSTLNLTGVTIEDGVGGIFDQGQGTYAATIALTDSTISGNQGVGIYGGSATVSNSTVSGNQGDGIYASSATVSNSTVSGNQGVGIDGGSATVTNSTVSGNQVIGIYGGSATVTNSTVSGNQGVGIDGGTVTVTNSTVSGNRIYGIGADGSATVIESTVSGNGRFGIASISGTVTASILAGNGVNCVGMSDGGYNLSTDTTCGFTTSTSQQGSSVASGLHLLPLGSYGGPTQTIALGPGSIAIDAIPTGTVNNQTVCLNATGAPIDYPGKTTPITTDQRGIDRPQGPKCDIGAYEAPALSLTVNPAQANGNNGWYVTDPTVTLSYSGLAIGQDSTGASQAQVAACTGLSGLSHSATGLNDRGSVRSTVTSDGKYTINCGVSQGSTALGDSYSGPHLPLTLKVDTTPPVITITTPTATSYTLHQTVDASYGCTDATSGPATCAGTVPSGSPIDTTTTGSHTFTVTATDNAGNTATKQVTYTVGYQLTTLPGSTTTVNQGYYAVIRFFPADANGQDEASRTLPVTSVELVGDGQTIPFVHQFQFATFDGTPGYQLILNTRNLAPGSWRLEVQVGSGSTAADGWITFTVVG